MVVVIVVVVVVDVKPSVYHRDRDNNAARIGGKWRKGLAPTECPGRQARQSSKQLALLSRLVARGKIRVKQEIKPVQ